MRVKKLKTDSLVYDELVAMLKNNLSCKYQYKSNETSIFAGEEYRFRTNSDQLHFVVLKHNENTLYIDIVCGGGGEGLFSFSWGSENAFIKKTLRLIRDLCNQKNVVLEEIT